MIEKVYTEVKILETVVTIEARRQEVEFEFQK